MVPTTPGRRYTLKDIARAKRNLPRYFWFPRWGMSGILRMSLLDEALAVSGPEWAAKAGLTVQNSAQ